MSVTKFIGYKSNFRIFKYTNQKLKTIQSSCELASLKKLTTWQSVLQILQINLTL